MKSKNLILTAMSLSLLVACKKQEVISTEVDYKMKLEQEFKLTTIPSSTKMSNKENKPIHNFATYEEQYKYLKELVKNTVIYDTLTAYPSSNLDNKFTSTKESQLFQQNNTNLETDNTGGTSGVEQNYYSLFVSKSANSSMTNAFTLTYSLSTTVNWPWKRDTPTSPPAYLGYCTFSDTQAYGEFLTYNGFMNMTGYNVDVSANGQYGTVNGTAQLYATTGGISNSISVKLIGGFTLNTPNSPQSPVTVYYTFTAKEPVIILP